MYLIRGSRGSLSFIFTHPPEDFFKKRKKVFLPTLICRRRCVRFAGRCTVRCCWDVCALYCTGDKNREQRVDCNRPDCGQNGTQTRENTHMHKNTVRSSLPQRAYLEMRVLFHLGCHNLQSFCFILFYFLSSGGWVKIELKLPPFHVSDTCVSI